jgi:hypothetical protein
MVEGGQNIRCVYYPYSRAINEQTLKKAVLLFDELVFLDSEPWFIRQNLLTQEYEEDDSEIEEKYEFLMENEFISIGNPEEYISEYDELITANVVNDMNNDKFVNQAIDYDVGTWDVMTERIPPSFFDVFYPGAGKFSEAISLQALINSEGELEDIPEEYCHFAEIWDNRFGQKEDYESIFESSYKFVVGGKPTMELETYELPFLQASSLRLNEALLFASMEGYIPFTDSAVHDRLLREKINRSTAILTDDPNLTNKINVEVPVKIPQQQLAVTILDQLIPNKELQERNLTELWNYRQSNSDTFEQFHTKIAELSTEIKSINPSREYDREIRRLVDSEVIPEIKQAQQSLLTEYEKSFGDVAARSATAVVPTLLATTFAGLGLWEVLGACALAEGGALAKEGVSAIKESWLARREYQRTPFAYFSGL